MDEKERELYFLREKSIKDEISALANAEEKGIPIMQKRGMNFLCKFIEKNNIPYQLNKVETNTL